MTFIKTLATKKMLLVAAALALTTLITVGATSAYFTDSKTASNVVTAGNVKISLSEMNNGVMYVVPGSELIQSFSINKVSSPTAAYVRAKLFVDVEGPNNPGALDIVNDLGAVIDSRWTLAQDGYYYYNGSGGLLSSNTVSILASPYPKATYTLKFRDDLGNEYQDASVKIRCEVQAIQASYMKQDLTAANPWGDAVAAFN